MTPPQIPPGYVVENNGGPFTELAGPLYRRVEAPDGAVHKAFRVEARHCNQDNAAHGGMLCTFIDNLFGTAATTLSPGGILVTATLTTSFVAAALAGDWVEGQAEVTKAGRRLVFMRAKVQVGERLVMTGEACFARIKA